jgi:hypothetical protein
VERWAVGLVPWPINEASGRTDVLDYRISLCCYLIQHDLYPQSEITNVHTIIVKNYFTHKQTKSLPGVLFQLKIHLAMDLGHDHNSFTVAACTQQENDLI